MGPIFRTECLRWDNGFCGVLPDGAKGWAVMALSWHYRGAKPALFGVDEGGGRRFALPERRCVT